MSAPVSLNEILSFGKFYGMSIKEIIDKKPSYIIWCSENIEWFVLDEKAKQYLLNNLDTDDFEDDYLDGYWDLEGAILD